LRNLVLDASVAVKWVLPNPEALTAESFQLLKSYTEGEINFLVPDLFWAEVANVLWKGARQQRWSKRVAEDGTEQLRDRNFFTISSLTLLPEALKIALAYNRSVYDSLYVVLAIQFKTEMITADERLANALAARLPVKWLGAYGTI
jgi:predicted nucleic acid-binding protein